MTFQWNVWGAAALLFLGGLVGFFLGYGVRTLVTRRRVDEISRMVDRVMRGLPSDGLQAHKEGDFGRLYDWLEILVGRTDHLVGRLQEEKTNLKDYVADVSHELKTPITALLTYLDLLLAKTVDETDRRQLERCVLLAEKMNEIIRCLLDLARLEVDDLALEVEEHALADVVDYAYGLVVQCGLGGGLTMVNEVARDIVLRMDERWMTQALFNIMKNAALYCGDGARVVVTALLMEATVVLSVKDNGPGLCQEDLSHVFDRFYRAKGRSAGGLGLGLPIAKMVVEKHHGQIEARSGDGTEFTITLPVLHMVAMKKV